MVPGGEGDADPLGVQRPYLQAFRGQREADKSDIGAPVAERGGVVPPPQALQLDVNLWVAARESLYHRGDVHAEHEPGSQDVLAVPGTASPRDGDFAFGEQPRTVFSQPLAGEREGHLPAAALK